MAYGGKPIYVMPLVFGGAPVINTMFSMYMSKAYRQGVSPVFYAGLILVIAGAATVLVFAPRAPKPAAHKSEPAPESVADAPSAASSLDSPS